MDWSHLVNGLDFTFKLGAKKFPGCNMDWSKMDDGIDFNIEFGAEKFPGFDYDAKNCPF